MVTVALWLLVPTDYTIEQIHAHASGCGIAQVISGIPQSMLSHVTPEDLPAVLTETIELEMGHFEIDYGDGYIFEYDEYYEVSHAWDLEANIVCGE